MQAGAADASSAIAESNLTELQWLYWIGQKLRPFATHFNNAFSFTFRTQLCPSQFAKAFATAVAEFDTLRTIFTEVDGAVQQHSSPEPPAALHFEDLSGEPFPGNAAQNWQTDRVKRPFTLDQSLYDTALLKLAEAHFVWFINQHHLITDASSFFLLAESVLRHYERLRDGEPIQPENKPPFARYASTLKRQQQSSRAAASRKFWQEMVAQKPEPLTFYGRSLPKISQNNVRYTQNLGPVKTAQLIKIADEVDLGTVTSEFRQFCLTAALYFGLLHQITHQNKLGLVTTVHNRATQINRQTVGVLMELCPVVVTIEPDETIPSLMQKVSLAMKPLLLHYRYGASRATVDMGLETMFTFVQRPSLTFDDQPVIHEIIHHNTGSEAVALHVHHLADDNSYQLYFDLHEDLFSETQMAHAQQSLITQIESTISNPQQPLSQSAIPWPEADLSLANGRSRPNFAPPTTQFEVVLQGLWQDLLDQQPIGIHDDFFELGGGSWQAMTFLSRFEEETGHYLPLSKLLSCRTIAQLAKQIENHSPEQADALIQIQAGDPTLKPLFLVPGAAGNTLAIQRLAQNLSPHQPVYTFEMPSFDIDNQPPAKMSLLADYYLQAIQTVQPHGPYHLGGYSAGGILAYELAQQLKSLGESVESLAIIDMPAPNPAWAIWWRVCHRLAGLMRLSTQLEEAIYLFGRDIWSRMTYFTVRGWRDFLERYGRRALRALKMPLKQKWERLKIKLSRSHLAKAANSNPVLQDMDPSALADPRARALFHLFDRAARQYLPQPYDGSLLLLRCPVGYGRKEIRSPYPDYGWGKLATRVKSYEIQANGHLALMQPPAVGQVGQFIQKSLDEQNKKKED